MATTATATKNNVPNWRASGDWFDVCKCNIRCPCIFAQAPSYEDCEAVFAYHVKKVNYGNISLDGLNVLGLGGFKGNAGTATNVRLNFFFDEKANEQQREVPKYDFQWKGWWFYG